jgi:hypothetical protein
MECAGSRLEATTPPVPMLMHLCLCLLLTKTFVLLASPYLILQREMAVMNSADPYFGQP